MRRALSLLAAGAMVTAIGAFAAWRAPNGAVTALPPRCAVPPALTRLDAALARAGARIARQKRLTIVAIGSSSTSGVGASSRSMSYPSRLQTVLRQALPGIAVTVLNRGIGGQEVADELPRLDRDVFAAHPDLVIWQIGTNAVLHHDDFAVDRKLLQHGLTLLAEHKIDVVLMDLQDAPRILQRRRYRDMEQLIADTARSQNIGLFRRFAIMQRWSETGQLEPAAMIAPDGLHMTDASYGCLAADLGQSLLQRLGTAPVVTAEGRRAAAAAAR